MPILEIIVSALATALLPLAEHAIEQAIAGGTTPVQKIPWVTELMAKLAPTILNALPEELKPEAKEIDELLEDAIDAAVTRALAALHQPPQNPLPGGAKP